VTTPARLLSQSLSGYLCGTHSGLLRRRRGRRLASHLLSSRIAQLPDALEAVRCPLGESKWSGGGVRSVRLAARLAQILDDPSVLDLVIFGSEAGGEPTGFSDLDAILVISDEAATEPDRLRRLRPRVLAAQRTVLAYQPMQHHGFEVATPRLLHEAQQALAMPESALARSRSLFGRGAQAAFTGGFADDARSALTELCRMLLDATSWPRHPWELHGMVSMFELAPTLYLQARGASVPKWDSFARARGEFGDMWWPYDVLDEVRSNWPLEKHPLLVLASAATRNPWVAVDGWRRLPVRAPKAASSLLTRRCLTGLQRIVREMQERTG